MKKLIAFCVAIALLGLHSHLPAQPKYSPYDNDIYINLNQSGSHGSYAPPAPAPYSTDPLYAPEDMYGPDSSGANYAPGCCGVAAAMSTTGNDYYSGKRPNTKGYQGVSCASRAGEVAGISVCEMIAATAVVATIAFLALIFNGGSVNHSH
jgi:hypothetical protein